jgi:hypothetical protein
VNSATSVTKITHVCAQLALGAVDNFSTAARLKGDARIKRSWLMSFTIGKNPLLSTNQNPNVSIRTSDPGLTVSANKGTFGDTGVRYNNRVTIEGTPRGGKVELQAGKLHASVDTFEGENSLTVMNELLGKLAGQVFQTHSNLELINSSSYLRPDRGVGDIGAQPFVASTDPQVF